MRARARPIPAAPPTTVRARPPTTRAYVSTGSLPALRHSVQILASHPALGQVHASLEAVPRHFAHAPEESPVSGDSEVSTIRPPRANTAPRAPEQRPPPIVATITPRRTKPAPAIFRCVRALASTGWTASIFSGLSSILTSLTFGFMPRRASNSPASNQVVAQSPQISICTSRPIIS